MKKHRYGRNPRAANGASTRAPRYGETYAPWIARKEARKRRRESARMHPGESG